MANDRGRCWAANEAPCAVMDMWRARTSSHYASALSFCSGCFISTALHLSDETHVPHSVLGSLAAAGHLQGGRIEAILSLALNLFFFSIHSFNQAFFFCS